MAVIANHPETQFPRPGVPVFQPTYLPPLRGMGSHEAGQIEALGRYDAFGNNSTETWGRAERLGGSIDAGLVICEVPHEHRATGLQETWLIAYADGWVAAELHDSWDSAADVFDRYAYGGSSRSPGALVIERHGYWLAADWDTNDFVWFRPNTWDRVPHQIHVTADQLIDDPGIRVWLDAQPTQVESGFPPICELLAPELTFSTLVGYAELARERGITVQAMRNRVSNGDIPPTFPDTGALWSRVAARDLVAGRPETDQTYRVDVARIHGLPPDNEDVWECAADDLPLADAMKLVAELRGEAEARGLEVEAPSGYQWRVSGMAAFDACAQNGWISRARAESNLERPLHHPPAHIWSDPSPITDLPATSQRVKASKSRQESRRGLLPRRPR
jgi:hypothetical protein